MSNHTLATEAGCSSRDPSQPLPEPELRQAGYQQALDDFAILPLLYRLQTYSDANFDAIWAALIPQEAETLAILLIQTLTVHLNGKLLATYLNNLRSNSLDLSKPLAGLLPPPTADLPATFPDVEMPRFLYGDRLCWICEGEVSDRGIVIGRFYSFAPHRCCWNWCYLIWLDPDSPSSAWIAADVAWEEDLQPVEAEEVK
jgi:hypothetical protein